MDERDSQFLRRQAELCIALSRATFDLTLAGRLRNMAEEFRNKASEWEDEGEAYFPHIHNGNGSQTGPARG